MRSRPARVGARSLGAAPLAPASSVTEDPVIGHAFAAPQWMLRSRSALLLPALKGPRSPGSPHRARRSRRAGRYGSWRADVLACSRDGSRRIAWEAQLSPITDEDIRDRTSRYQAEGIGVCWVSPGELVPWMGIVPFRPGTRLFVKSYPRLDQPGSRDPLVKGQPGGNVSATRCATSSRRTRQHARRAARRGTQRG